MAQVKTIKVKGKDGQTYTINEGDFDSSKYTKLDEGKPKTFEPPKTEPPKPPEPVDPSKK
jgi:hypothetical protein